MQKRIFILIIFVLSAVTGLAEQKTIDRVEKMPNMPSPYEMRDWKKVAGDYDAFVFDLQKA